MCNQLSSGSTVTAPREVLPAWVTPSHYRVAITPNLSGDFKFNGVVEIDVNVNESTKKITVNANEIEVSEASVTVRHMKTENTQQSTAISYDKALERVTFEFANEIPAGATATVRASFVGTHNDQMAGFYRSGYTDQDGTKKHLVVTQFEATDCRRAFPSFDEPALKATFDVTLIVEPHLTALSNMNSISSELITVDGKQLRKVAFATTPIMSTYLVACAVGDFEYIEKTSYPKKPANAKPITCRVYTLKGEVAKGQFALDVCVKTLEFFSEYFDIAYPLPKMDMIAIPDFGAGAMENWGLVTYRTIYLLFDAVNSSAAAKERIAYVVGHELAHQWFGNLVTMTWWNDLWLNEGFATFVGWLAVDAIFPEWKIWTRFVIDDFSQGLALDGLRSSHPIDVDIRAASEINEIFDAISYSKGASVIRMLNTFLGGSKFMNGVRTYLKEFTFRNTVTADLWRHLAASSQIDVSSMMHPWTREMGYPLVTVTGESYDATTKTLTVHLRQNRFLSSGPPSAEEDKVLWWIPLGIVTHLSPSTPSPHVFTEREAAISFPYDDSHNAYWKLNFGASGFYRVKLQDAQIAKLAHLLQTTPAEKSDDVMPATDRIMFVADAFALTVSGLGSAATALDVVMALQKEENYMVLDKISTSLSNIKDVWHQEPKGVRDGLNALGRLVFAPKVASMGWDFPAGEDQIASMKRALVITTAATSDDKATRDELKARFKKFADGEFDALNPNIRSAAYHSVLATTTNPDADLETMLQIYKDTRLPVDQRLIVLMRLGNINSLDHAKKILNTMVLDFELVRPQDVIYPLRGLLQSPLAKDVIPLLWDWVLDNYVAIEKQFAPTMSLFGYIFEAAVVKRLGEDFADKVQAWAACEDLAEDEAKAKRKDQLKGIKRSFEKSCETVRANTKWVNRERAAVAAWVAKNFPSA